MIKTKTTKGMSSIKNESADEKTDRESRISLLIGCYLADSKLGDRLLEDLPLTEVKAAEKIMAKLAKTGQMVAEKSLITVEYLEEDAKKYGKDGKLSLITPFVFLMAVMSGWVSIHYNVFCAVFDALYTIGDATIY